MKQGIKKALGIGALCVALGFTTVSLIKNIGEEVYRGNIDGKEVVYEEGKFAPVMGNSFFQNKMNIQSEDKTYVFIDDRYETNIDWRNNQEPDFKGDELEKIIVKNLETGEEEKFTHYGAMSEWKDPKIIEETRAKKAFEKGNKMYNDFRTKIREGLRADYEARPNPLD